MLAILIGCSETPSTDENEEQPLTDKEQRKIAFDNYVEEYVEVEGNWENSEPRTAVVEYGKRLGTRTKIKFYDDGEAEITMAGKIRDCSWNQDRQYLFLTLDKVHETGRYPYFLWINFLCTTPTGNIKNYVPWLPNNPYEVSGYLEELTGKDVRITIRAYPNPDETGWHGHHYYDTIPMFPELDDWERLESPEIEIIE